MSRRKGEPQLNRLLGAEIKRRRLAKSLTQKTLADQVEIASATISAWEVGDAVPGTSNLSRVAKALGTTVNELLEAAGGSPSAGDEATAAIETGLEARQTPDSNPEELQRVIDAVREIYASEDADVWDALCKNLRVFALALRRGRQQRLGQLAVREGYMTKEQLRFLLRKQLQGGARAPAPGRRFRSSLAREGDQP